MASDELRRNAALKTLLPRLTADIGETATAKTQDLQADLRIAREQLHRAVLAPSRPSVSDRSVALAHFTSSRALPDYCTLDQEHVTEIESLSASIARYAVDSAARRPLNILMLATPGAGKSHFIKCLASKLEDVDVEPVTYNMAVMERAEDLAHPLDTARTLKVEDKLPLLFLDEFDSNPAHYALLLPLLWDGELQLGHRDLKLGKVVIVLAGSRPEVPRMMEAARAMRLEQSLQDEHPSDSTKIVDLLSRINGAVLNIPDLELVEGGRDRRLDKICMAITLLKVRFGRQLESVPRALLRFIALTRFRYGVRSITHLISLIPPQKRPLAITADGLRLPVGSVANLRRSSLAYHLVHEDQAHGIVDHWNECLKRDVPLRIGDAALIASLANRRRRHP